jgi:hypothetical protein
MRSTPYAAPSATWVTTTDVARGVEFVVLDGAGGQIVVNPEQARILGTLSGGRAFSDDALRRLQEFLADREAGEWLADAWEEERLAPGDAVRLLGAVASRAGEPASATYRDRPSAELVLAGTPDHALVIATPAAVRRVRLGAFLVGEIAVVVGVGLALAGILARWLQIDVG